MQKCINIEIVGLGLCGVMVIVVENEFGCSSYLRFHCANTFEKGMNSSLLPPAIGKTVGSNGLFSHSMATNLGKRNY